MNNNDIIQISLEIRKKVKDREHIDDNIYLEFEKNYPKFYTMLKNTNMNEDMFNKLIQMMTGTNTLNEKDAAEFSTFGAEKYLYPQFGKPTEEDIHKATKKISKLY